MSDVATTGRRDVAVRQGRFYGSPACCNGRLCTWEAYSQATAEAAGLVAALGPGWKAKVWENIGWHYEAVLSSREHSLLVMPSRNGSLAKGGWVVTGYSASFNYDSWHEAETPQAAVIAAVAEVRAQMDALGALLALTVQSPQIPEGGEG